MCRRRYLYIDFIDLDVNKLDVNIQDEGGEKIPVKLTKNEDGTVTVEYVPKSSQKFKIEASIEGEAVMQPVQVEFEEDYTSSILEGKNFHRNFSEYHKVQILVRNKKRLYIIF